MTNVSIYFRKYLTLYLLTSFTFALIIEKKKQKLIFLFFSKVKLLNFMLPTSKRTKGVLLIVCEDILMTMTRSCFYSNQ